MLYKTLEFPKLPDFYNYDENILKNNFQDISPFPDYADYRLYLIPDRNLEKILQPYFSFDLNKKIRCQVIKKNIVIHKDVNRELVYNYIVNTGGDSVSTVWYNDDMCTEMFNIIIPKNTWHVMDVTKYHTVKGISTTRIAFTIFQSTKELQ